MRRVTLGQVFGAATIAIAIVVIAAFAFFVRTTRASILQVSQKQQELVARRVEARVVRELGRAQRVLDDVDHGMSAGAIGIEDPMALEADLFTRVLDDPRIEEVTFTHARVLGYAPDGKAQIAPDPKWQLSVFRAANGSLNTKITRAAEGGFTVLARERGERGPAAAFMGAPMRPAGSAPDPTAHLTFSEIAAKAQHGRATWSDLHWSELDHGAPADQKRVVVSVQKTVEDPNGRFLGVLRVGMVTRELDAISRAKSEPPDPEDVERVALLATSHRGDAVHLVARVDPSDTMAVIDDEIRVLSKRPPPEIAALFASPIVKGLDRKRPLRNGDLVVDGQPWLATLCNIELGEGGTEGWMVAVLVPEARYTADLVAFERLFLITFGSTLALVLAIGLGMITSIRSGLARVTGMTNRMRGFDFKATEETSKLRDIDDVMKGLERAKTVVRAMGKYVPLDLVRKLYSSNAEPQLGGELVEISMMFTDIEGFTTLSEKLPPDELARRLGDYLAAMTDAIESTGGTIDKYIGDAVMAIWNMPTSVADHPRKACRAALACIEATKKLYASSAWSGLPALVTRFGLHEARVMVGHFGAPTRLSYTALGDGVNLAARLEPLCKQYGVVLLVSEVIATAAKSEFVFRRIDRVAVKGKTTGIDVYELLGAVGQDIEKAPIAKRYEEAFDAYLARDFARAQSILEPQHEKDAPSAVLLERCKELMEEPPPEGWTGVHIAKSK